MDLKDIGAATVAAFFDNCTIPCGGSDLQDHPSKIVEIGGKFACQTNFARGTKKKLYALRSRPVDQLMRLHPVCTQRNIRHRRPANVREQGKTGPTQADGWLAGEARTVTVGAADVIDRLAPLAFVKRTDEGLQYRLQGRGVPFPEATRFEQAGRWMVMPVV